jgi:general secretion pathway protein A
MYESFYGLNEKPFNLNPDPDYLYMSEGHENTYTHLVYAISESKGFVIVTGEIGAGKTTLVNYLLHNIPEDIQIGLINNTHIPSSQFIKLVCREYEIDVKGLDKAGMVDVFHDYLIEQYAAKKRAVLIIDEAQNLTPKTMEEIRLLSNLESEKHHLIQIIMVGQPELRAKLQRSDLQQFVQRVTVHCHLSGLSEKDVGEYITHRMKVAGAKESSFFDEEALSLIAANSRGIPRLINLICDTALVYGYADSMKPINAQIVRDVIKERVAGGLFSFPDSQNQPEEFEPDEPDRESANARTSDNGELKLLKERMQLFDDRFRKLESELLGVQQLIEQMADRRDQKDDLIIELFKLLKGSMDSRLNTILRISEHIR